MQSATNENSTMGKVFTVFTTIAVTNRADQIRAKDGTIPPDATGVMPDLKSQTLRVLPIDTTETYLTIL